MPFGISVDGFSEGFSGSKAKNAAAGDDLDSAMNEVNELEAKLVESKKLVYDMLNKAVPKVDIPMPKLSPSLFGDASEQEPLLAALSPKAGQSSHPQNIGTSKAKAKAEEIRKKTLEAQREAQEAQKEMQNEARQAMEQQIGAGKQVLGQMAAAAISVAIGVGISLAPLGPFVGQLLAAVSASIVNLVGLVASWKKRSFAIFQVLNKVFERMKNKVVKILDTVDDMIMGPLEKLENAIEDMAEEQKPSLDKMKKLESAMKMADPNFNLPDPGDLQKPLDGCEDLIDQVIDKAKKEVPEKMEDMVQSTVAGRIATDESAFNRYVVMLPLSIVLIFNVALSVAQVWFMFSPEATRSEEIVTLAAPRQLRGSSRRAKLPDGMQLEDMMPYIQPALVQIALAGLQMAAALILSSGPQICGLANATIAKFGKQVNDRINDRIKSAVDRVFGDSFKEVKAKSDEFFPKFEKATQTLKQAMQTAGKAGAMVNGALDAAKGIGSVI